MSDMGIHLVMRAMYSLRPLSKAGRLVLITMAAHALDTERNGKAACVYWGGWRMLALNAFGMEVYDERAERAVGRAVHELTDAKLIEVEHKGFRTEYRLNVEWLGEIPDGPVPPPWLGPDTGDG
jgi:DNA-binding transcriptional ArsR family regulator